MATITCAGKALKVASGHTLGEILELLGGEFGECSASPPRLYSSSGEILFAPHLPVSDGDYTYDAVQEPKRYPPPSQGYSVVMARQMVPGTQVLNFMPATAVPPLPLQLMHEVFGCFIDDMRGEGLPDPTMADYTHFNALVTACSTFYENGSDMRTELRKIWRRYLEVSVIDEMYTGACDKHGSSATDLGVRDPLHDALVLLGEVERGVSLSRSEPLMQAISNYELNWNAARVDVKALLSDTCLPALIIQHIGQQLLVGGVITLPEGDQGKDKICYQPLASADLALLHGHDLSMAMQGVRTCMAIKAAVTRLITFYGKRGTRNLKKGPSSRRRELFRRRIPAPLHPEAVKPDVRAEVACEHKRVYILRKPGEECVVKYCQHYGADVHKAWGDAGLAPKFLSVTDLWGGWLEVRMEWLPEEDGWKLLYDLPEADRFRDRVLSNLAKAHKVEVRKLNGKTTYGVHGDMRDNNVMVKITNEQLEVRFIDFDWAKEEDLPESLYPGFINHGGVNWSPGVGEGLPMRQEHDKYLLGLPQAKQIKTKDAKEENNDDDDDDDAGNFSKKKRTH